LFFFHNGFDLPYAPFAIDLACIAGRGNCPLDIRPAGYLEGIAESARDVAPD
jgi:hypothetical protein